MAIVTEIGYATNMHIYFSGIGGTAIGPLALIAKQAGYQVSGSDKQDSAYIAYLKKSGISDIHVGQTIENIQSIHQKNPIDWLVYSSAVVIEDAKHPELEFATTNGIKSSKRDELLNQIISDKKLKLLAVAGTHGKTTTTAMLIWLFKELDIPISYSVGAKIPFGEMGHFDQKSEFFVYECDEFDRNFLAFRPYMSLITGIDYDHHEIFPSREDYRSAFRQFLDQSQWNVIWKKDVKDNSLEIADNYLVLDENDATLNTLSIVGMVNRLNALQVIHAVHELTGEKPADLVHIMNRFPGLSRRFEKINDNLYTDYAHTVPKIRGCLQMAHEISDRVVVVYEPLTDRRQHYIKDDYGDLFKNIQQLYWVPSYLAREDPNVAILNPSELIKSMNNPDIAEPAKLDESLKSAIQKHLSNGDLVVCLSGGGGGSLDEWLRDNF